MSNTQTFNNQAKPSELSYLDERASYYTRTYGTSEEQTFTRLANGRDISWGGVTDNTGQTINRLSITYMASDGRQRTIGFRGVITPPEPNSKSYSLSVDETTPEGYSTIRGIHPNEMPNNPAERKALFNEAFSVAREALSGRLGQELRDASPNLKDDVTNLLNSVNSAQRQMNSPSISGAQPTPTPGGM